jgi:hypothetical protein
MVIKSAKNILLCFLLIFSNLNAISQTITADPAYWNMQRTMGGILQQSAQARGYSTTDPRTYSTLYSVGKAAAVTVAGAGTALLVAGTAPAWGTFLAMSAIGGAVSYGVSLGIDKLVNWYFNQNTATPINVQAPASTSASTQQTIPIVTSLPNMNTIVPLSTNQLYSVVYNNGGNYYQNSWFSTTTNTNPNPAIYGTPVLWSYNGVNYWVFSPSITPKLTSACPAGYTQSGANCILTASVGNNPVTTNNQTLTQAINALTAAQLAQGVNYDTMAYMLNQLWQKAAAQPDYAGVPYSATQPITAAEVQAWAQANPTSYPTVASMVTPITNPNGFYPSTTNTPTGTAPTGATSPTPSTGTNAGQANPVANLGTDPNIKSPSLEATPTAQMILSPLIGLFPDLKSFAVPGHSGTCPTPSFDTFGHSFTIDSHCNIFESNRGTIAGFMLLVFAMSALFIILKA